MDTIKVIAGQAALNIESVCFCDASQVITVSTMAVVGSQKSKLRIVEAGCNQ